MQSEHRDVVESIAVVVFMGIPHRGSVDNAAVGEIIRSLVSTFGITTTPVILDSLGLKNTDLERAQEDFSRLWQKHDFKVKTFQEGLIFAKLGRKVLPEYSSLLGTDREHAETLQSDHVQMCRYSGTEDPNYRKVAGEIRSVYLSLMETNPPKFPSHDKPQAANRTICIGNDWGSMSIRPVLNHCGFQPSIEAMIAWKVQLKRRAIGSLNIPSIKISSIVEFLTDTMDFSGSKESQARGNQH
ncbi:hypothetical protein ACHAPU_006170 [Fusarium lateritium]